MADYQRVVEFLRDVRTTIATGNTIVTDELRQTAAAYADLCTQANERLRQCSAFLAQGLRSEAIHLADENPNLLDLVAALDLPEPNQWAEFCQLNDLPVPPTLQMDRAQQLNEAYAADQPLEALLNRHRWLALARAPVRDRLDVLRQIAAADPSNGNWEKDVRVFEKARLKELPTAFYGAMKRKDVGTLVALQTEVNGNTWLESPPSDLSTALSEAYRRVQRADADSQLRPLVEPLRDAYAARDYQQCAAIVSRWKTIMETAEITTCAQELAHEVQPVVEWLRQEDELQAHRRRFERATETLVQLLDSNASETDLEAAYVRMEQFNETIPPELQARYEARRVSFQKAQEQSHRLRLVAIAAVVLVVLGLSGGAAWYFAQAGKASKWASRLNTAVMEARQDVSKIELARSLAAEQERVAPNVGSSADVKAAKASLESVIEEKATQERRMAAMIASLTQAVSAAKEADAITAPPQKMLQAAADAGRALTEASTDVSWVDAGNKVNGLRHELGTLQTQLINKANGFVRTELARLEGEVAAVSIAPGADVAAINAFSAKINELSDELNRLRAPGIDPEVEGQVNKLVATLGEKRKAAEASSALASGLQGVRDAADSADRLRKAMERFVTEFPDSDIAGDFRLAMQAVPAAKAVEAYGSLIAPWAASSPTRMDQFFPLGAGALGTAQQRIDEIEKHLATHPVSPKAPALNRYADYFHRMQDALGEKRTWRSGYGDLLSSPLLAELSYIETDKHRKFYVLAAPKITEGGVNNERVYEFKVMNPRKPSDVISVEVRSPEKLLFEGKPQLTPHAKVVRDLSEELKSIQPSEWETFGIDTIDKLMKNSEMDPVVRGMLISHTLQSQQAVLGPLAVAYDDVLASMRQLELDNVIFYDKDRPVSETALTGIRKTLAKLPTPEEGKKSIADRKEAMIKSLMFLPEGSGVLFRDASGYHVDTKATVRDGLAAYAVKAPPQGATPAPAGTQPESAPAPAPTPGSLVKVATFKDGKWAPVRQAPRDLPQGTMVFIVPE